MKYNIMEYDFNREEYILLIAFKNELYTTKVNGIQCQAQACNFVKKEALAQVFSCDFCEVFNFTFFTEHLWTTAIEI